MANVSNSSILSKARSAILSSIIFQLNETFTASLERERVRSVAALEQRRLEHAAALEQERLEHSTTLERERLDHGKTLERERLRHAAAIEECQGEIRALQSSNGQFKKEIADLKKTISDSVPRTTKNPVIGTFYAHDVRPPKNPCLKTSLEIPFASPYPVAPGLPIGLNMLDIPNADNIRVSATADNIRADRFEVGIKTWANPIVRDGGCTWLEVEASDPDFQFGKFDTTEDYPWTEQHTHHTRVITFPRPYHTPPKVVVWLTTIDMCFGHDWRVRAYETNVTAKGFTLHIDTWGDSVLYFATATWVAYPADKPNVSSGKFSTLDVRPENCPQLYNSAYVNFGNTFTTPPRILLAFNSLSISCKSSLRLAVKASNISAAGMSWHLDSWSNTTLYSAGASYIALD